MRGESAQLPGGESDQLVWEHFYGEEHGLAAAQDVLHVFAEAVRPKAFRSVSGASKERIISSHSARSGRFNPAHVPCAPWVMDQMNRDSSVRRMALQCAVQMMKTEILLCVASYYLLEEPSDILIYSPTEALRNRMAQRMGDLIRMTQPLVELAEDVAHQGMGESKTRNCRTFANGAKYELIISTAKNAFDERSARVILLDEVDDFAVPNLLGVVEGRLAKYKDVGKIYASSSPKGGEKSVVAGLYRQGTMHRWHVQCPARACGKYQVLAWANVGWRKSRQGKPISGSCFYRCQSCGEHWTEDQRLRQNALGEWRPTCLGSADPALVSAQASWLNAPDVSMEGMRKLWYEALAEDGRMNLDEGRGEFMCSKMGEPYASKLGRIDQRDVEKMRGNYTPTALPPETLKLVAAVDVQQDRLEAVVAAVSWDAGDRNRSSLTA